MLRMRELVVSRFNKAYDSMIRLPMGTLDNKHLNPKTLPNIAECESREEASSAAIINPSFKSKKISGESEVIKISNRARASIFRPYKLTYLEKKGDISVSSSSNSSSICEEKGDVDHILKLTLPNEKPQIISVTYFASSHSFGRLPSIGNFRGLATKATLLSIHSQGDGCKSPKRRSVGTIKAARQACEGYSSELFV